MSSSSSIIPFLLLFTITCFGQGPTLSGRVLDSGRQPVPFAGVTLLTTQDSVAVKNTLANENGHFEMETPQGNYVLKVTAIGFEDSYRNIDIAQTQLLPDIVLKETIQELGEVVVTSRRPIVKRKVDRLEFNVENSTLSSENAWEILRKTPGVTMAGDNVSIRGSSGILVTINDKKVYLTGTELKNLLENTDGENVKSIEVITTPPAKYEAQGSAVLNIKMKKAATPGYKGSVAGAYVQGVYPKGVVSTNHYYTNKKLSVTGGLMYGSGHYHNSTDREVKFFDEAGNAKSTWKSSEDITYMAEAQKSYNVNFEYQLDSINSISIGANGFDNLRSTAFFNTPTHVYGPDGVVDSLLVTTNDRQYPRKNNTVNAAFEHKLNDKDKLSLSGDYTNHYFNENQDIFTAFSMPGGLPYRDSRILSDDTRNIYLLSVQADYNAAKWGSNIEAGLRYGTVNAENDFSYSDYGGVPDAGLSNRFLYDEKIFAGYLGFDREIDKWSFKAGLRGEYTDLEGNSETTGQVNTQKYFKIFPSLYTLYKPNENNQIGLTYGKRIIRPQYGALNPFRSYTTPYSYATGDPGLQPAIGHNLSLQYTLKQKYNIDLFYQYQKDPAIEVIYQDYNTNALVSQYTNIKSNTFAGLSFNTNLQLYSWWESGLEASMYYGENTFQGIDGLLYTNNRVNYGAGTNNRFTLSKAKDWLADVNFSYNSASVEGPSVIGDFSNLSASVRKKFLKEAGELTLIFSDIYKGQVQETTTQYANQYSYSRYYGETQTIRLQFRYRFGNQKLGNGKTREQTEEQRRL